jgi:hypothetical protein
MADVTEWWSIEAFHSEFQVASRWKDACSSSLIESAVSHGALEWAWIEHPGGVLFEVCFTDDAQWEAFRRLPEPEYERVPDLTAVAAPAPFGDLCRAM